MKPMFEWDSEEGERNQRHFLMSSAGSRGGGCNAMGVMMDKKGLTPIYWLMTTTTGEGTILRT